MKLLKYYDILSIQVFIKKHDFFVEQIIDMNIGIHIIFNAIITKYKD